ASLSTGESAESGSRVRGVPVGKDPTTNENIFVASGVASPRGARKRTSRGEDEVSGSPGKLVIPVHRGYRLAAESPDPSLPATPPPKPDPGEVVAQVPPADSIPDLPKWHMYQKVLNDTDSTGDANARGSEPKSS